ncbi:MULTISPECIES: LamB/YcsF family protein [unclassified Sporolactobacillus]|uniref:LamB/YcsF family protein n=1 Tax=unclassified Sporolactobacillus TaxID=2628533 RepID=UPI0023679E3E|nr:5-oxoprolinase subunit PxpA [Sporolactobacillus sp. CQH2019]MDD9148413.1 5-oxoprolinase subunit PxpA [Sporolactobacillus sp. CQH2019]
MVQIDLNCDLGESFGHYVIGNDEKVLPLISSANIACGFHAGDPSVMHRTIVRAEENGVAIGAHPGLPDLEGFGRREMAVTPAEVYDMVVYQVGALQAFAAARKVGLNHVKPHGALYHMASEQEQIAEAVVQAVKDVDAGLLVFGMDGTSLTAAAEKAGLRVVYEAYADRTYQPDGSLTPRTQPHALITDADQAIRQVLQMIDDGTVLTAGGRKVSVRAETICLHGDGEAALAFAKKINRELKNRGIEIAARH